MPQIMVRYNITRMTNSMRGSGVEVYRVSVSTHSVVLECFATAASTLNPRPHTLHSAREDPRSLEQEEPWRKLYLRRRHVSSAHKQRDDLMLPIVKIFRRSLRSRAFLATHHTRDPYIINRSCDY